VTIVVHRGNLKVTRNHCFRAVPSDVTSVYA